MKQLLLFFLFVLTTQFTLGQACGIYRIEYVGSFVNPSKEIVRVHLPTTMLLHGIEKENDEIAFVETTLIKGSINVEICSHLTTPYTNIDDLLSLYQKHFPKFPMKVFYYENNLLKEETIKIDWNDIEVKIVEDGKFGTLFKFTLNALNF